MIYFGKGLADERWKTVLGRTNKLWQIESCVRDAGNPAAIITGKVSSWGNTPIASSGYFDAASKSIPRLRSGFTPTSTDLYL